MGSEVELELFGGGGGVEVGEDLDVCGFFDDEDVGGFVGWGDDGDWLVEGEGVEGVFGVVVEGLGCLWYCEGGVGDVGELGGSGVCNC